MSGVEGRARVARPSACVFLVVALLAAIFAQSASAAPTQPSLTGTNPPSPSTATRPYIQGVADSVITSAVPRASAAGPDNEGNRKPRLPDHDLCR